MVGMVAYNPCHTSMEVRLKLSTKSTTSEVDVTMYCNMVGILHYLMHTMSDVAFAVGYVIRFMEKPWQAAGALHRHQAHLVLQRIDGLQ
jgi:hypothetical protein